MEIEEEKAVLSYCDYIAGLPEGEERELNRVYHDTQYGFPIHDDNRLFGRLILEINQAGLSWLTILKKQQNFYSAFDGFDIGKIANYKEADRARLLADSGIIRNRLKIDAVVFNAKAVAALQQEYGSFENWLDCNHPLTKDAWVKLFKTRFKFVGGEIVNEFLVSTGYLPGAHKKSCPVYQKTLAANPKWTRQS